MCVLLTKASIANLFIVRQNDYLFALFRAGSFRLAVIHAGLVQNAFDDELYEPVILRRGDWMRRIDGLSVAGQELLHQRVYLAETLYPGVAGVPVLVLQVIGQPR